MYSSGRVYAHRQMIMFFNTSSPKRLSNFPSIVVTMLLLLLQTLSNEGIFKCHGIQYSILNRVLNENQ